MKLLKSLGAIAAVAALLLFARASSVDRHIYLCKPADADICERAQFATFNEVGLCAQAAETFCFYDHFHYAKTSSYSCVQGGTEQVRVRCGETEVEVQYVLGGMTQRTRYEFR